MGEPAQRSHDPLYICEVVTLQKGYITATKHSVFLCYAKYICYLSAAMQCRWNGCPTEAFCPCGVHSPTRTDRLHVQPFPDCEIWKWPPPDVIRGIVMQVEEFETPNVERQPLFLSNIEFCFDKSKYFALVIILRRFLKVLKVSAGF